MALASFETSQPNAAREDNLRTESQGESIDLALAGMVPELVLVLVVVESFEEADANSEVSTDVPLNPLTP